jgi:hypothetical protein
MRQRPRQDQNQTKTKPSTRDFAAKAVQAEPPEEALKKDPEAAPPLPIGNVSPTRPLKDEKATVFAPNLNSPPSAARPLTGSNIDSFSNILAGQVCNAIWTAHSTLDEHKAQMQACLGGMAGVGPKDEVEGMLAAQMVALHNAAMECFRRAMIQEQPFPGRQQNLSFANKLSRTFALHMETLDKHRGKGQQTVRVEHVTVNAGGQAIVGNVQGGGGVSQKSEDQSHANKLAYAPKPAMRSAFEAEREAVPERSDEER